MQQYCFSLIVEQHETYVLIRHICLLSCKQECGTQKEHSQTLQRRDYQSQSYSRP